MVAVEIRREGKKITLVIEFMSEAEAAETCDSLNAELQHGEANLTITAITAKLN